MFLIHETHRRCPKCTSDKHVRFIQDNDRKYKFKCFKCSYIFTSYDITNTREVNK